MKNRVGMYPEETHPTYSKSLINTSAMPKKIFEPFRTKIDARNYRYVVDWEIEDNDLQKSPPGHESQRHFYYPDW